MSRRLPSFGRCFNQRRSKILASFQWPSCFTTILSLILYTYSIASGKVILSTRFSCIRQRKCRWVENVQKNHIKNQAFSWLYCAAFFVSVLSIYQLQSGVDSVYVIHERAYVEIELHGYSNDLDVFRIHAAAGCAKMAVSYILWMHWFGASSPHSTVSLDLRSENGSSILVCIHTSYICIGGPGVQKHC